MDTTGLMDVHADFHLMHCAMLRYTNMHRPTPLPDLDRPAFLDRKSQLFVDLLKWDRSAVVAPRRHVLVGIHVYIVGKRRTTRSRMAQRR